MWGTRIPVMLPIPTMFTPFRAVGHNVNVTIRSKPVDVVVTLEPVIPWWVRALGQVQIRKLIFMQYKWYFLWFELSHKLWLLVESHECLPFEIDPRDRPKDVDQHKERYKDEHQVTGIHDDLTGRVDVGHHGDTQLVLLGREVSSWKTIMDVIHQIYLHKSDSSVTELRVSKIPKVKLR